MHVGYHISDEWFGFGHPWAKGFWATLIFSNLSKKETIFFFNKDFNNWEYTISRRKFCDVSCFLKKSTDVQILNI
jgi:hypothetical protein